VTALVVDASVAVKWFVVEIHSAAARRCLRAGCRLSAPDIIRAEMANVFWKKTRRGELTADSARSMLKDFLSFPVDIVTTEGLVGRAYDMAVLCGRSVYDCLYLALAEALNAGLITADRRFYDGLSAEALHTRMLWVEDLA
jgi:predicted nucleic acid-binding protein